PEPHVRTTPACAGTTRTGTGTAARARDYPRVRGDDVSVALRAASEGGLPPRARGRHESESHAKDLARTTPACAGTTPACAGTTSPCPSPRLQSRDYPRVRGDDFALHLKCASRTGLPPRARGRLFDLGPDDTPDRTTPACAGT